MLNRSRLTIVAIGTIANLQAYILEQDRLGFADRAARTRIMPLPNQPEKSITLLNQFIPPARSAESMS